LTDACHGALLTKFVGYSLRPGAGTKTKRSATVGVGLQRNADYTHKTADKSTRSMDCRWALCNAASALHFAVFPEAVDVSATDDHVIQDHHVEHGQRAAQFAGQRDVGFAGLCIPGRVVVGQDHGGCIVM